MRMARRLVAVALAAAVGVLFAPVARANHTALCNELPGVNRWSGIGVFGAKQGVRAYLEGQSLDMCTPGVLGDIEHASFAYVNIQGSNLVDIVQIGVGRCVDSLGFNQCNGAMSHNLGLGQRILRASEVPVDRAAWLVDRRHPELSRNAYCGLLARLHQQ